jgi:hypothetical protein
MRNVSYQRVLAVRIKNNHAGYAGGLQSFEEMWLGPVGRQSPELVQQARAGAATSITRTNWIAKNVDAVRLSMYHAAKCCVCILAERREAGWQQEV